MKRCPQCHRVYAEFVVSCPLCKEELTAAWKKPENVHNTHNKSVYPVRFRVEVDDPTNFAILYAGPPKRSMELPEVPPEITIDL